MPTLHLLGTGAALAGPDRTTTMLAFEGATTIVVDCGGDVVQRLLVSGIDLDSIAALIITHEHPDHVSGFPLFMEKIWLAQRRRPVAVVGIRPAINQAKRIFEAFDTSRWKGLPKIEWREVELAEDAAVWADDEWRIAASPGIHSVPVVGFRVEHVPSGVVMAYSGDTEKSAVIERLGRGAAIFVHEATGGVPAHSSAADAARVASGAGAARLVLVHIPPVLDPDDLREALELFPATEVGEDGARYAL